jgi:hypothetical protein
MSMRLSHDLPCRTCRLLFAVVLLLIWGKAGTPNAVAATADPDPARARELARLVAETERNFAALEAAGKEIPRESFDPAAVVRAVGRDPERLFEWVRDETHWVPYRGVLRGPTGVLMDRLGGTLDRALLLAELLKQAGHSVRLARAELPASEAEALAAKVRPPPPDAGAPRADAAKGADEDLARHATAAGIDVARVRKIAGNARLETQKVAEDLVQRVATQAPVLQAHGSAAPPAPAGRDPSAATAIADHWWVQVRGQAGQWTDLDPLLPDARPGTAAAAAARSIDPDAETGRFPLPDDLHHTVRVRVVVEQWADGKAKEQVALDHVLRPSELHGTRIVLGHAPLKWPRDVDLWTGEPAEIAQRLSAALRAQREWLPILSVGGRDVTQASFYDTGDVNPKPGTDLTAAVGSGSEGLAGRLKLGAARAEKPPEKHLTAEWVEYEVRSPGRPPEVIRREIFDLKRRDAAGRAPAAFEMSDLLRLRRACAALEQIEILAPVCRPSPQFVEHLMARGLLANKALLLGMFRGSDKPPPPDRSNAPPGELYNLAVGRWTWSRFAGDLYHDRPNLFTYRSSFTCDDRGEIRGQQGFDIVSNFLAIRPGSRAVPFEARVAQGVLDTNLEAALMRPVGEVRNTGESFGAAIAGGAEWQARRPDGNGAPSDGAPGAGGEALPPAAVEDLARGFVVVTPPADGSGAAPDTWWRVHPVTGETLGRMGNGWGQSTSDYFITLVLSSIPSIYLVVAGFLCKRAGRTDGLCHPCLFAVVALIGLIVGFAGGAMAMLEGTKGVAMFFGVNVVYGGYSFANRLNGCWTLALPPEYGGPKK